MTYFDLVTLPTPFLFCVIKISFKVYFSVHLLYVNYSVLFALVDNKMSHVCHFICVHIKLKVSLFQ